MSTGTREDRIIIIDVPHKNSDICTLHFFNELSTDLDVFTL